MKYKDYYETLGVSKTATQDEIKQAYRKLARKYHPDVSKMADAEARFKDINEANEVLKDPEKRAAYDQVGSGFKAGQDFQPPPNWDAGFEFRGGEAPGGGFAGSSFGGEGFDASDFFESLFGARSRAGAGRPRRSASMQGEDHHAKVLIDLEDAFRGAERSISLRVPKEGADGRVTLEERRLDVHIPKGIRPGQHLRLSGQGAPGQRRRAGRRSLPRNRAEPASALSPRRRRSLRRSAAGPLGSGARRQRRRGHARRHGAADDSERLVGRQEAAPEGTRPAGARQRRGRRSLRRAHHCAAAGRQRQGARRLHGDGQHLRRLRCTPPARRLTMNESRISALRGSVVEDELTLTTVELSRAVHADEASIELWVSEGVLQPSGASREHWRFSGRALSRVRVAMRLTRDLELNASGVALALDLLDEIEALEAQLRRRSA